MDQAAAAIRGARGVVAASAITLSAGIITTATGIIDNDTARTASGASLIILGLASFSLVALRRWITDTSAERGRLADAQSAAQTERARYEAALSAVEAERARVRRDAATMANHQRTQLAVEREKLHASLERDRERIVTEAFRTGALMERAGLLAEPQPASVTHIYANRARALTSAQVSRHPS